MLDYAAFPEQRQSLIRQLLVQEGRVVCADLAEKWQVSEDTIRRDLQELAREGVCKKVYGGAVSIVPPSGDLAARTEQGSAEKARLGAACAQLVKAGSCIFIDAGSTNLALAHALPDDLAFTAVTNTPAIAVALMAHPHCDVIMLGGRLQRQSGGSVGITAQQQAAQIAFDQVFLGGCALDAEEGMTVFDYEDAAFKKSVMLRSNEVIMAMTAEKVPGVARYSVAACEDIAVLVVERTLPAGMLAVFKEKNIRLVHPE